MSKGDLGNALRISIRIIILGILIVGSANAATITVCKNACAYSSIQAAIDIANNGDTIQVQSGIYYEDVNIYKKLTLHGIGMPVVNASGRRNVITLSVDGIRLEGFTVTGSSGDFPGGGIKVTSNNSILGGNYVSNKEYGISLFDSRNNTISGNNASNNEYGISLSSSGNNTLSGNNVSNNIIGIYLSDSGNNTVSGNNVSSNNEEGISLYSSNNNTVSRNYEWNNYYGISLFDSSNNTLRGNYASNNGYGGYGIRLSFYSNNNTLNGNNVTSKNNEYGIYLESSSNNTLNSNYASNNYYGVYLFNSTNNTLSDNNASNNYYGTYLSSSSNNTLSGNNVRSNNKYGIYLESSSNNNVYNNYFDNANNARDDGNNIWNTTKTSGTNIINGAFVEGNFWNDYAGKDTDRDGIGDTMLPYNSSGRIATGGDYLPLTVPVPFAVNIRGIPVTGHITSNIMNLEYTNFSSGEAYNISIITPNGTRVYYDSGTLNGTNPEIIPINWIPSSRGNYTIEAWGRGMNDSAPVYVFDSGAVSPAPGLGTILLVAAGMLGLIRIRRDLRANCSKIYHSVKFN